MRRKNQITSFISYLLIAFFIITTLIPSILPLNSTNLDNNPIILQPNEASTYYISANWLTQPVIIDGNVTSVQEWSDATVLKLWTPKYPLNATLYFKNNATHLAILCDAYGDESQDSVGPALNQIDHMDIGFDTGNDDIQTDTQEDSFSILANGTVLQWEYNNTAGDYNLVALESVSGGATFTGSALNTNNHEIYETLINLNTIYANVGDLIGITSEFSSIFNTGWSYDTAGQSNTYPLTAINSDLTTWGSLKLADQPPVAAITGTGDNQSALFYCENDGIATNRTENSDFNVSIPSGMWNQTWVDASLNDISAPNITYVVEDASASAAGLTLAPLYAQSFRVNNSCYLNNVTVQIQPQFGGDNPDGDDIMIRVFNATNNGGTPQPDGTPTSGYITGSTQTHELTEGFIYIYFTFNYSNIYLDISNTYDQTFFISLARQGSITPSSITWKEYPDPPGPGNDSADEAYAYTGAATWSASTTAVDFDMKVGLAPPSNTPQPSQIGMKINGSDMTDAGSGQGTWNSSSIFTGNNVLFDVQSNWTITYNVTWQTAYEKMDVGTVDYQVGLGSLVDWNVTTSISFPTNYKNFEINMSIPTDWNASSPTVLNGSSLATLGSYPSANYIWYASQGIVQIKNMTEQLNYWRLDCEGYNYLTVVSLEKQVGLGYNTLSLGALVNITDTIRINGTVEDNIGNPISELNSGNLTVYTPQRTAHAENGVDVINGVLYFTDWLISTDTDEPGTYTIRLFWFNGLEVGLNETTINVVIPTEASKISPTEQYFFIGTGFNDINVTAFYNCTFWAQRGGISDINATFRVWNYSTLWLDWTNMDQEALGFGYYNHTFDYSSWTNGTYTIQVNLNKTGYQAQKVNYTIYLVFNTAIALVAPPSNQLTTDYPENLTIQVNYTKAIGDEILTANVELTINGSAPLALGVISDLFVIQLNSTDYGVGFYNLTITASLLGYFSQQIQINWTIQIATTNYTLLINGTQLPIGEFRDYHYNQVMNITVFYNDTVHGFPITGAPLNLTLLGNTTQIITTQANGWYSWIINTSDYDPGLLNFSLSVEKPNYQNHTRIVTIYARFNTSLSWIVPPPTEISPGDPLVMEVNLTRFGIPLAGQNITFHISTNLGIQEKTIATNENGSARFDIGYVLLSDVTTITITVLFNGNVTDFPSSITSSLNISPGGGIFEKYWWVFIIIAALLLGTAWVVRSRRKARVAKEMAKQEILTSFQDVTKILHLVVIHKGTGADIFDYKVQERLDPTLLAGFIQAVKEFGKQLDQEGH